MFIRAQVGRHVQELRSTCLVVDRIRCRVDSWMKQNILGFTSVLCSNSNMFWSGMLIARCRKLASSLVGILLVLACAGTFCREARCARTTDEILKLKGDHFYEFLNEPGWSDNRPFADLHRMAALPRDHGSVQAIFRAGYKVSG